MRIVNRFTIALALFCLATVFANCSFARFSSGTDSHTKNSGGDYYTGKPQFYFHFADVRCTTLGKDGRPLPNRQIFLQGGVFNLVRDNCVDLVNSQAIPLSELQISNDQTSFIYQGQSFALNTNFANYDLMPTRCPAGFRGYNTAAANLYRDPYDFTTAPWNSLHPIVPVLDGAIGALPRYLIEVTSPNAADWFDWRRTSQGVVVRANTAYAARFILRPGTRTSATIGYYEGAGNGWAVTVDLLTGALNVRDLSGAVQAPAGVVEPYIYGLPGSMIVTLFFTTTATATGTDIGVAPAGTNAQGSVQPGFSIYATAADLREVAAYCVP